MREQNTNISGPRWPEFCWESFHSSDKLSVVSELQYFHLQDEAIYNIISLVRRLWNYNSHRTWHMQVLRAF